MNPWKLSRKFLLFVCFILWFSQATAKEIIFVHFTGGPESGFGYIDGYDPNKEMDVKFIDRDLWTSGPTVPIAHTKKVYVNGSDDKNFYTLVVDYSGTPEISNKILLPYHLSLDSPLIAHPEGKKAYLIYGEHNYNDGMGRIGVIDTQQEKVIGLIDCRVSTLSISDDGKFIYAGGPKDIYVIDTSSDSIKTSFTPVMTGQTSPYVTAPTPDGKHYML